MTKYNLVRLNHLNGSDMFNILFIEAKGNEKSINNLVEFVRVTDNKKKNFDTSYICDYTLYSKEDVLNFFKNPLFSQINDYHGGYDTFKIFMLSGSVNIPELCKNKKECDKQWEAILDCTKFPNWNNVCEKVKLLCEN